MTIPSAGASAKPNSREDVPILLGLAAVLLFFLVSGGVAYWNTRILNRNSEQVAHTHEVITSLAEMLSLVKDAETGQRGYLLTGTETYLEPYNSAVSRLDERLNHLLGLTRDQPEQRERLQGMEVTLRSKMAELAETLKLRRERGFDAALLVVKSDRGKQDMDRIRTQMGAIELAEKNRRAERLSEMGEAYRNAIISGLITALLGAVVSLAVAWLLRRNAVDRRHQLWLQSGQSGLAQAMLGEQRTDKLGENILEFLSDYCHAPAGAVFVRSGQDFRRCATYGVPANDSVPARFNLQDGLLGQAAKDGSQRLLENIPEGYLRIGSGLGQSVPRHLLIAPAAADGEVNAVLELGFLQPVSAADRTLLEMVAPSIATAVKSANYRENLQNFLEETQRQGEELQSQSEELRVNNEELEEQSRALKESQVRLEQQQSELEQTNAQLEEQAQTLEGQRDDLARSEAVVQQKAKELEQASQYKSDFLANMSHELRTPLNSSLILSKLLADNREGNLTAEQIKFAQTIQSAGNDLLTLINDILDLSKIEAGHMEITPEKVSLERISSDLRNIFEPLAKQRGITLKFTVVKDIPSTLETDRQRLEQVLKNLLSNALKFTEKGTVGLEITQAGAGHTAFAVTDTGIGIATEQQQAIFDAFKQADGTISRKFGGTGLGLSISRELARLLGGRITLESTPGQGSRFTVILPEIFTAPESSSVTPKPFNGFSTSNFNSNHIGSGISQTLAKKKPTNETVHYRRFDDDRKTLNGDRRIILVVEDDESFAGILYDMVRELNFQCLVATSAEEALTIAKQYLPSAVVLDVGLPDHSGLSVLDRLKRDARTRHIPVHVVSAGDHAQTALSLGAVGYMLKPVKREALAETLKNLESRLEQRMRRVLIVEDDAVQRDSMQKLLGSQEVETIAVGTAAECLKQLQSHTFDCMVLDLSLPDASGYSLLETLSREDAYSFPPVIVYTGRDLSSDEEQRLRRYSKSIIIKGVKSPERLLDEVTLFLHQVVADLPSEQQRMLEQARNRDAALEGKRVLVVEDDVRNIYALTNILEPHGVIVQIARNGREAIEMLEKNKTEKKSHAIDLVLMDVMMPEMDGLTATRKIRLQPEWRKLPIIMLTAKAMKDDQERCIEAGANDYMAKPLDVEKLLSLVRVWMPR